MISAEVGVQERIKELGDSPLLLGVFFYILPCPTWNSFVIFNRFTILNLLQKVQGSFSPLFFTQNGSSEPKVRSYDFFDF